MVEGQSEEAQAWHKTNCNVSLWLLLKLVCMFVHRHISMADSWEGEMNRKMNEGLGDPENYTLMDVLAHPDYACSFKYSLQ